MDIKIKGMLIAKATPAEAFSKSEEVESGRSVVKVESGYMNINKKGEVGLKLCCKFPEFLKRKDSVFDIAVEKNEDNEKFDVMFYFNDGKNCANFFLKEGESTFYSSKKMFQPIRTGVIKTIDIKNELTKDGGSLFLNFKASSFGIVVTVWSIKITVVPADR